MLLRYSKQIDYRRAGQPERELRFSLLIFGNAVFSEREKKKTQVMLVREHAKHTEGRIIRDYTQVAQFDEVIA